MVYADLPVEHRLEMTKEKFLSSLGNLGLQRHLLGVATPTIEDVVRAGNEYMRLNAGQTLSHLPGTKRGAEDRVEAIREERMDALKKAIEAIPTQVEQLTHPGARFSPTSGRPAAQCWGCHEIGHMQRDCPRLNHQSAPKGK